MKNSIKLQDVNLHYSSVAYQERSLKSLMANIVNKKKQHKVSDIHALKDITLEINEGERVGLLGHNGAGKSTFLKTVAGLYPVSSGHLEVTGTVWDLSLMQPAGKTSCTVGFF